MKSKYIISILIAALLVGCSSGSSDTDDTPTTGTTDSDTITDDSTDSVDYSLTGGDITDVILVNTSANCEEYVNSYYSSVTDVQEDVFFTGTLDIEILDGKCNFTSNSIPNHDFDGTGNFATKTAEVALNYSMTTSPEVADEVTALSLGTNAVMLNGVKLDILADGCYGVGDGKIGCSDISAPFRYDPMSPLVHFGTDSHNAHTQPTGQYHYHGDPIALYTNDESDYIESPVIGFAQDGFPIYGMYYKDDNDVIQKTTSSYELKTGARETSDGVNPPDENEDGIYDDYDGQFRDDYEYVEGSGVLDECNGMTRSDGTYGYYVTDSYPWVIGCYKGTPDNSFSNGRP